MPKVAVVAGADTELCNYLICVLNLILRMYIVYVCVMCVYVCACVCACVCVCSVFS